MDSHSHTCCTTNYTVPTWSSVLNNSIPQPTCTCSTVHGSTCRRNTGRQWSSQWDRQFPRPGHHSYEQHCDTGRSLQYSDYHTPHSFTTYNVGTGMGGGHRYHANDRSLCFETFCTVHQHIHFNYKPST